MTPAKLAIFAVNYKIVHTFFRFFLPVALVLLMASCASPKKIEYFRDVEQLPATSSEKYEPVLQADDLLLIIVSSSEPEAAMPYNLNTYITSSAASSESVGGNNRFQTYLIDNDGNISFPVIGKLKMGGLKKSAAVALLETELAKYIKDPIILMRISNYKFSVMGEVARPGVYASDTERTTLPEALSRAGDLTIFGNRKEILVIRENNGVKTHNFVDITSSEFINSPFYYVDQNDVIYVKPNRTRVNASAVGPNIGIGISVISLALTLITLLTR